ncbi:ArgP/LysG family DNA-binding transcriptional regulator [Propioniciclava soli]|uniref:ArgP/LysG family DNA-binding transcriptional regulator n=1 Tax=Propioniciclava soli TaxID=2775081 RepID=A0ABZ3C4L4_9ACTN
MQLEQLRAFATAIDLGTLDAAARELSLTPSAMSQRLRALEASAGAVLLERTTPVRPTAAGEVVLRLARQVLLLQAEARSELDGGLGVDGGAGGRVTVVRVVVNADSLATWFPAVFDEAAGWADIALHLTVADQAVAAEHLSRGAAMAAVTSRPRAAPGCRSVPLGVMRYHAMARADLVASGLGPADLPMVNFGPDDDLQDARLAQLGVGRPPRVTQVPSAEGFLAAVAAGLGWGMVPAGMLARTDADLCQLRVGGTVEVPLFWHRWRLASEPLDRLSAAVEKFANIHLAK